MKEPALPTLALSTSLANTAPVITGDGCSGAASPPQPRLVGSADEEDWGASPFATLLLSTSRTPCAAAPRKAEPEWRGPVAGPCAPCCRRWCAQRPSSCSRCSSRLAEATTAGCALLQLALTVGAPARAARGSRRDAPPSLALPPRSQRARSDCTNAAHAVQTTFRSIRLAAATRACEPWNGARAAVAAASSSQLSPSVSRRAGDGVSGAKNRSAKLPTARGAVG